MEEVNDKALKRQRIIDEDRFRQQIVALRGIASLLSKPGKDDKEIIEAIEKQGKSLDKVAEAIRNQPKPEKPEKPEVNVITDNKEILPLLREIKEGQLAIKAAFENRPVVDEFKIHNTDHGSKTVKVIYKPSNQVTFKK